MLEQLLRLVKKAGGALSSAELASHLSVGEPLVRAMLDSLVQLGYLEVAQPGCVGGCGSSARSCAGCPLAALPYLLRLTPAGLRALESD